jgi:hypothetical protein
VVKLAVAIRDLVSQMIRPAPGSIPGRCILLALGASLFDFVPIDWTTLLDTCLRCDMPRGCCMDPPLQNMQNF